MAACGLERDGHMWTCAACGHGQPRGAAAAARRRGHKSRRRARLPAIRACARRRRASARARGRRGSSFSSCFWGFLASRRRRREAARSRASWRCPEHRLPASLACARQTSCGGCSSRAAVGRGLLGCLSGSFQGRSRADALQKPRTTFKAAADESTRRSLPTGPRAPQRQMRPTTASQHGRGSRARRVDSLMITRRVT